MVAMGHFWTGKNVIVDIKVWLATRYSLHMKVSHQKYGFYTLLISNQYVNWKCIFCLSILCGAVSC